MLSNIFFLVDWDGTKKPRSTQTKESSNWPGGAVRCTKKMCLPLYFHGCLFRLRNFVPFYFKLLLVCSREICSSHLLFFCLRKNEAILCLTSATKLKREMTLCNDDIRAMWLSLYSCCSPLNFWVCSPIRWNRTT